jgi:hypothetical protein
MTRRFDGGLLRASGQQKQNQARQSRHGSDLEASGVGVNIYAGNSPKEKGARRRPSKKGTDLFFDLNPFDA